ncbi:hypothetical protein AAHA92_15775 [Salvia divinorum]|uniref:Uncharacterized protein n=1 Tax=Salvia divinorum TaxID=28513 RepID=A0ABD1HIB6_SALDI
MPLLPAEYRSAVHHAVVAVVRELGGDYSRRAVLLPYAEVRGIHQRLLLHFQMEQESWQRQLMSLAERKSLLAKLLYS